MGVGKTTFTFSTSNITIDGGSTVINLTIDNPSYTNKLSHGYGDIYTFPAGATSYTWKPTAAQLTKFLEEAPSQKLRTIDVYLDTYNGSTLVGRDTHSIYITLSQTTGEPTISDFAITDSNSTASAMGVIVVGKSKLTAGATVTPKYGASITKSQYVYGKKTSGTSAITNSGFLDIDSLVESLPLTETPTDYVISYRVGDSRGFSKHSKLITKTFVKYQAPHIDNFEVVRRDTSGNEDENGTKALVIVKGGWASINGKNTATLKVGYKIETATSYTYQTISVTNGTVDVTQTLNATLATNADYVFSVQLSDKFETFTESGVGCSNVQSILYVSADGNELVMGSNASNNVMIDPNGVSIRDGSTVNATFTKDKIELGKNSSDSIIEFCGGNGILRVNDNGAIETYSNNAVQMIANNSGGTEINANAGANSMAVDGVIAQAELFAEANTGSLDDYKNAGVVVYASSKSDNVASSVNLFGDSVTSNNHGIENLVWMFAENNTSTLKTYSTDQGWHTTTWHPSNFFVGPSYTEYFTIGDSDASKARIKVKKAGYYRLKNVVSGNGAYIMAGLFSSEDASGELFTSVSCGASNARSTATVEAVMYLNVDEIIYFRVGNGSGSWIKDCSARFTNSIVEYLGYC